ncbi:MAG: hypothetical protein PWP23_3013 [Candidatus Sumerlaeota bacterium]|nr:hypothetical protein [Candidatus Sumerlaeota bacterium]
MKDQLVVYGNKLLKNLDRVAVVVFVLLVLWTGLLYMSENNYQIPEAETPAAQPFEVRIPDEEGNYARLERNFFETQPEIGKDPRMRRLVSINMFDAQSVKGQAELAREIENDFRKAEEAFGQQNYDSALSLIDSILRRNPAHRRTLELKDQIIAATTGEVGS